MDPISSKSISLQDNASLKNVKIFDNCSLEIAQQTKRIFAGFPRFDLLALRNTCSYIENAKEELLKKAPSLNRLKGGITIFCSSSQKIYLFFRNRNPSGGFAYCIGKGSQKSIYLGFDYFREKPIAYLLFDVQKLLRELARTPLSVLEKAEHEDEITLKKQNILQEIDFLKFLNQANPKKSLPGIIKIIDSDVVDEKIIGIYKYYSSGNLNNARHALKTDAERIRAAYDLLVGLTHLTRRCSQHNDIKEDNILSEIKFEKATKQIKHVLADFGLATTGSGADKYVFGGTPYYYSPEKIRAILHTNKTGELSYEEGNYADVWALGCVLFQLFFKIECPWYALLIPLAKNFYKEKETAAKIVEECVRNYFKNDSDDVIYNLLKEMLQPDCKKRITAEKALERIKKLLPEYQQPLIPRLNIPENYSSSESLDTPGTADTSTPTDTPNEIIKGSAKSTPKTNRVRTYRSRSSLAILSPKEILK